MVSPCTGSSPFVAFAARLRASDSLAEAVFSHTRSLDARPAVPRLSRSHPVAVSVFANVRAKRGTDKKYNCSAADRFGVPDRICGLQYWNSKSISGTTDGISMNLRLYDT